jgi:hypothetical protein
MMLILLCAGPGRAKSTRVDAPNACLTTHPLAWRRLRQAV